MMHLLSHFVPLQHQTSPLFSLRLPAFDLPQAISASGSLPCAISLIIFFYIATAPPPLVLIISLHILVFLLLLPLRPLPLKVFFPPSTP